MLDKLNERLKELQKQKLSAQIRLQQAHDDMVAIDGAIQEVCYWMKQEVTDESKRISDNVQP
jgi:hypothetical protein